MYRKYILVLFVSIGTSLFAGTILQQNFEDTSVFVVGQPFGLSGVGSSTAIGGLWKNTNIDGNYSPRTVSGNTSFSGGSQCVEILRTSTYGSGLTAGYRANQFADNEFQVEFSSKISDSSHQFSADLLGVTGQITNQISIAYFGESLQIRDNGTWRDLNKSLPINTWFRVVITGSFNLQSFKVYLDTGTGEVLVGTSSFDQTQLNEISGIYIGPWQQNYYIYLDDVLIQDEIMVGKSAIIDWDSDTYLIWAMKSDAVRNDVPISITDWYLWYSSTYGKSGVRYILNTLAANGVRHVWWRMIGGVAHGYRPQVDGATQWQPNGAEGAMRNYDPLEDAIEYGHKLGIKIYAWFIPLEEYHGTQKWDRSRYTDNHKDLWDWVYSSPYSVTSGDCPSFCYSEYRDYKISLVSDFLRRYDIDGVIVDFERLSYRNNNWGYLPQIRQAFQDETGRDPWFVGTEDSEWMAFRARYVGDVLKAIRGIIDSSGKDMDMIAWYPWETPLSAHWDIMTWAQEDIFDMYAVYAYGSDGWGSPGFPTSGLYSSLSSQLQKPILFGVYVAKTTEANILNCANAGINEGFDGLVWFEGTPLIGKNYQDMPRNNSARDDLLIQSLDFDLTNGGEIFIISAGSWELGIDDLLQPIATGAGGIITKVILPAMSGYHNLLLSTNLDSSCPAGIAVEGYALNAQNQQQVIKTDTDWVNISGVEPLLRFGQPGISPFLGE